MTVDILMPMLSPTMEQGSLTKWCVSQGDAVTSGDVIAEIETDTAVMELEASETGTIAELLVPAGDAAIAVNTPIALLQVDGETSQPVRAAPIVTAPAQISTASAARSSVPAAFESSEGDQAATVMLSQREALRDAMAEEMRRDADVFIIGEEVAEYQGAYKVTQGLLEEFGTKRVVDTPITEHGFTGLAVGAAFAGLRPVVEFMTFNFAMQAMDQIINSAAKTLYMSGGRIGCPIVFRGPNGPASRVAAQHSQDYASWYSHIPGLTVVAPWTAADAKGLLKAAIRDPNPVVMLESELLYGIKSPVPEGDFVTPIGKGRIVREGSDVTLVSFSNGMTYAMKAAEVLAEMDISAEVIDLRSLRPLDTGIVQRSLAKTHRLVTIEEGWPQCGIGSEIAARMMEEAFDELDAPILRVSGKDVPMPYAANLEKAALPLVEDIIAAVRAVTYR